MRIFQLRSSSSFSIERVIEHYNQRYPSTLNPTTTSSKPPFYMILPPPNVTGNLHLGHALTVVMEDTICRYHRRNGRQVEWYPGFDHAGIATQTVVERQIYKEKGLLRSQMSTDEFLGYCNLWKDSRINTITSQLKKIGASLNWDNCYYTMDDKFSSAVTHAFCRLHSDGFIFREKKLINWCPTLQSAISDQEVDGISIQGKTNLVPSSNPSSKKASVEVGVLHLVRYKLINPSSNDPEYLEVATTRPETLFADMALAVNSADGKNNRFINRHVKHPLTDKILPVIADEAVKIDKGTGILKVTPSHDFIDYEIARRHENIFGNDYLSCINEEGKLVNAGNFNGIDRLEAKPKVIKELISREAYGGKMEQSSSQIPICSRTGDFIEPMLREQWFLGCKEMNKNVIQAIEQNKISIFPEGNRQKLLDWLEYTEPWCLSRQLIWGHQIPAYKNHNGRWTVSDQPIEGTQRDTDVLDTWFSSALIPLVTRGWPQHHLPANSLPINLMETGHDIIGFWVARMLILCQHLSGKLPFDNILLHGLVRDSAGRKMSKSLGNVIDPLDVSEGISQESMIKRLKESNLTENEIMLAEKDLKNLFPEGMKAVGPDALRFALLRHDLNAEDINVSIADTAQEGYRFCNKLWNLVKYADIVFSKVDSYNTTSSHEVDLWILSRLKTTLKQIYNLMDAENDCAAASPHLAFAIIKDFLIQELCEVYLETTKTAINDSTPSTVTRKQEVAFTLQRVLQLSFAALEPFLPFVSTYLGDKIPGKKFDEINVSQEAMELSSENNIEKSMNMSLAIINATRSFRVALEIPKKYQLIGFLQNECQILPLNAVLKELINLRLEENEVDGSVPLAISGQKCTLFVQIEPSQKKDVIDHLQNQLQKFQHRKNLMAVHLEATMKILKNVESEPKTKPAAIKKSQRKVKHAENSLQFATSEMERLEELLKKLG